MQMISYSSSLPPPLILFTFRYQLHFSILFCRQIGYNSAKPPGQSSTPFTGNIIVGFLYTQVQFQKESSKLPFHSSHFYTLDSLILFVSLEITTEISILSILFLTYSTISTAIYILTSNIGVCLYIISVHVPSTLQQFNSQSLPSNK